MGYTTEFSGSFFLDKPLTEAQRIFLADFAGSRRIRWVRNLLPIDPVVEAAGLKGDDPRFYTKGGTNPYDHRQIEDSNNPPADQPGLWCQWVPSDDGTRIEWDGGEKFYKYTEWLKYIVETFLKPWGLSLTGVAEWQGEESSDVGKLIVRGNIVTTKVGRVVYD